MTFHMESINSTNSYLIVAIRDQPILEMGNKRCYQDKESLYYFEVESDREEEKSKEWFPTCLSIHSQPKEYHWKFGETRESKETEKETKCVNWGDLVDNVFR